MLLASLALFVSYTPHLPRPSTHVPPCRSRHESPTACADEGASRAALERLFRTSSSTEADNEGGASVPPGVMIDLPLWRVQWTALPYHNQVLHVHVPHYCHMFEELIASAGASVAAGLEDHGSMTFGGTDGPQLLFGHLMLPGGSSSLGKPESLLTPGTTAPTIGTLMLLREVRRMGDGRLAVHAEAIGRFRVLRGTQASPYSKADVAMLPDAEETSAWLPVVETLHRSSSGRLAAARAAAAAAASVWATHEAAELEPNVGVQELAAFNVALDEPQCVQEARRAGELAAQVGGTEESLQALEALDVIGETWSFRAPAWGPWRELFDEQSSENADGTERDSRPDSVSDELERAASIETLRRTEQEVWTELITCLRLTRSLRTTGTDAPAAEVDLPEALRMLLPPSPDGGWPAGAPTAPLPASWLARYPPHRRALRLSYVVAAVLPDIDKERLLECSSTTERLEEALYQLRETSGRLAALAALKQTQASGDDDEGNAEV